MIQALHLLRKDLRAMRLPLFVFYLVLIAQSAIVLRDPLIFKPLSGTEIMAILFPAAILAIGGMLVQQEPLVGTTAFWMTRPIRRGTLLLSKAIFLFLFVIAPIVLATLGILLNYGMQSGGFGAALGQSIMPFGWLLVGAVLMASVTPNMPAYVTAWICLLLASSILGSLLEQLTPARMGISATPNAAVAAPVYLCMGALLIFHQYFTRRTRRTLIGIAVAYVAAPVVCGLLITLWASYANGNRDSVSSGQVAVGLSSKLPGGAFPADPQQGFEVTVSAIPRVRRAPPGLDIAIQSVRGDVWADGNAQGQVRGRSTPIHFDLGGVEAAMPGFRWAGKPQTSEAILALSLPADLTLDDLGGKPAALRATAHGELFAYRLAGTVPLAPGARFENGATAAVISTVTRRPSSLQLELRTRQITVIGIERFPRILLVNRRREEIGEGDSLGDRYIARQFVTLGGPTIQASEIRLSFPAAAQRAQAHLDEEWLRDAELAFFEWVPAGWFEAEIEVDDFRLVDETRTGGEVSSPERPSQ